MSEVSCAQATKSRISCLFVISVVCMEVINSSRRQAPMCFGCHELFLKISHTLRFTIGYPHKEPIQLSNLHHIVCHTKRKCSWLYSNLITTFDDLLNLINGFSNIGDTIRFYDRQHWRVLQVFMSENLNLKFFKLPIKLHTNLPKRAKLHSQAY